MAAKAGRKGGQCGQPPEFSRVFLETYRQSREQEFIAAHNSETLSAGTAGVIKVKPIERYRRHLAVLARPKLRRLMTLTFVLTVLTGGVAIAGVFNLRTEAAPATRMTPAPPHPVITGSPTRPDAPVSGTASRRATASAERDTATPAPRRTKPARKTTIRRTASLPPTSAPPTTVRPSPGVRVVVGDFDLSVRARVSPGQRLVLVFRARTAGAGDEGSFPCQRSDDTFRCTVIAADLTPGVEYWLTTDVVGEPKTDQPLKGTTDAISGILTPLKPVLVTRIEPQAPDQHAER